MGQSIVQRGPTDWAVPECDHEEWTRRGPRAVRDFREVEALRQAYHLSRGVLMNVVCLRVVTKHGQ